MSKVYFGFAVVLLLAGCRPQGMPTPGAPTPLTVQITSALGWLKPAMAGCAAQIPSLSLSVQTTPQADQSLDEADVLLRWSGILPEEGHTFELGQDHLVVIIHPENPVKGVTGEQLKALFTGEIVDWSELAQGAAGPIYPWVYPENDDSQLLFTEKAAALGNITGTARIAPHPEAMLSAVGQNPLAIGMTPARWLEPSVKTLTLNGYTKEGLTMPILAVSRDEPSGLVRDWLLCVQEATQP